MSAHPHRSILRQQPFFILRFMHYFRKYALYSGTMQSFWTRVLSKTDTVLALIELKSHKIKKSNFLNKKKDERIKQSTGSEVKQT